MPVESADICTADSTDYTADNASWPTADGGLLVDVPQGGGVYYPPQQRPFPAVAVGFGILPELEGEGHGVILAELGIELNPGTVSDLVGQADGTAVAAGDATAQIGVRAAAAIDRGQVGTADAILRGLLISGGGNVSVRGRGSGVIVKLEAAAIGQQDDDEAALMAFLLVA